MVVKNRYALPYKGDFDATKQVVLSRRFAWPKVPSLLVLPLVLHEKVLGTLILGARRRHAFGDAVRPTLEVLASHLSVSLSNARMVQKLEQMATTDGMTGLLNKRAMLEAAEQKVAASARFGRKLSVVVTDIDWFKKVNDTYGHDVGDVVIKGLGAILTRQKRSTDQVARFGGEEFVVLCEQTDEAGAMLLAERIREELEKTTFHAGEGDGPDVQGHVLAGRRDLPRGRARLGRTVQGRRRGALCVQARRAQPCHGLGAQAARGE